MPQTSNLHYWGSGIDQYNCKIILNNFACTCFGLISVVKKHNFTRGVNIENSEKACQLITREKLIFLLSCPKIFFQNFGPLFHFGLFMYSLLQHDEITNGHSLYR